MSGAVAAVVAIASAKADESEVRVGKIMSAYTAAVGGQAAITHITSREVDAKQGRTGKFMFFWQSPDRVVRLGKQQRQGSDGGTRWVETKKKRVLKLSKEADDEMQTIANPLRFVRLRDMYRDLQAGPDSQIEGRPMSVLLAPNKSGSTKFYFADDHLLYRIDETGVTSVYFKHTTDFSDYRTVDGVRLPFRIHVSSDEPGAESIDWRVAKVKQNEPIDASLFRKPKSEPAAIH